VNVNVVDGVVYLRGEVKRPEQVKELEREALRIPEVRGVENLLHLHKTPAPTRADAPRSQQRTGTPRARTRS
jgi:osmotically-inducible protein OsmY